MIDAPNTQTLDCAVRVMKGAPGFSVSAEMADTFAIIDIDYWNWSDCTGACFRGRERCSTGDFPAQKAMCTLQCSYDILLTLSNLDDHVGLRCLVGQSNWASTEVGHKTYQFSDAGFGVNMSFVYETIRK